MEFPNAKDDVLFILSQFSETISRPPCKLFSASIVSFIQLDEEAHTSSLVRLLSGSFLQRSLSSFAPFLGKNAWAIAESLRSALPTFSIPSGSKHTRPSFLWWMIPRGEDWHEDSGMCFA